MTKEQTARLVTKVEKSEEWKASNMISRRFNMKSHVDLEDFIVFTQSQESLCLGTITWRFLNFIHHAVQGPRTKYSETQTES